MLDNRLIENLKNINTKLEQYKSLFEISLYITSTLDKKVLLPRIMECAKKVMKVEGCSIIIPEEYSENMYFEVALGEKTKDLKEMKLEKGEGIAGSVAEMGEPVIVNDVSKDERFSKKFDEATGFETKSVLCVPMKIEDKTIGVIELVNKKDSEREFFSSDEFEICKAFANLAAIAIHNANSYKNAITDRLTKLYNFGYFSEQLYKELLKAKRYNYPVSLVIIDIDHFKNYNDSNGHQEGNVALVKTAGIITENVRESDTAARYGGEEFILMLPQTIGLDSLILAERIRHNIETVPYTGDEKQPSGKVTISCGIASFPEDGNTPAELIEKADMALYYSKNNGRNRVTLYNDNLKTEKRIRKSG